MFDSHGASLADADLVCFSCLRWDSVYRRAQHLLSRAAKQVRVFFVEEPVFHDGVGKLELRREKNGVLVVTPQLPRGISDSTQSRLLAVLVDGLFRQHDIRKHIAWYDAPMALKFTRQLEAAVTVYDCMDQLPDPQQAPAEIAALEQELFERADLVFTAGLSLYEAKRELHGNVHPFPGSVDVAHFGKARAPQADPADQAHIGFPRIGFMGTIDERVDLDLIRGIALARPDWQLVLAGPVVKIDDALLPRLPNIHYLGGKPYEELPAYLSGWNVAILPFVKNDATKHMSPAETPEYLAAGCRVVSTSIQDVIFPYGDLCLAGIGDGPEQFVALIEEALLDPLRESWEGRVNRFLSKMSWDRTFSTMWKLVEESAIAKLTEAEATSEFQLGRTDDHPDVIMRLAIPHAIRTRAVVHVG